MQLITNSLLTAMDRCPRQYFLRVPCRLVKERTATPLRLGSTFHRGLELLGKGETDAINKATEGYAICPEWADADAWAVERETVRQLLAGHFWRYEADNLEFVAVEKTFKLPLLNPATGRASRSFALAGKIDGIVRLPDGRLALLEYKTAGEDIDPNGSYWMRLRYDAQISLYVLAARALGFDAATVLYDVTRKPSIRPCNIPQLDENGLKVVRDAAGERVLKKDGSPRLTGDTEKGWTLVCRPESAEEFGARLLADIGERPDFYFQRREVPRTEDVLAEFQSDLWNKAQMLAYATKGDRWPRAVSKMNCNFCEFREPCLNGVTVTPTGPVPSGFTRAENVNPELQEEVT